MHIITHLNQYGKIKIMILALAGIMAHVANTFSAMQ